MTLCQTHCKQGPDFSHAPESGNGHVVRFDKSSKSIVKTIGFLQFLPMGQHGLCFGYLFSGPLPLRSLIDGPPFGVLLRESLVIKLYSEIDQIHLSTEAQCGTTCLPLSDCHRYPLKMLRISHSVVIPTMVL